MGKSKLKFFYLVYKCEEEKDFGQLIISLSNETENLL